MSNAPLSGITVIEAASFIAGPFATQILADLGADVTKVEPPRGDPYRRVGKKYGDSALVFRAINQNKQSVVLDLKSDEGTTALAKLLAGADLFISNWRPGVAERMGFTAERVRRDFPDLIWIRVSGYGQDGPMSQLPAYDGIIQARSGGGSNPDGSPATTSSNVADKVSAMFAAQTATAALHQRSRTGTGAICDVAMVDAMAYFYGGDISAGHRIVGHEVDPAPATTGANEALYPTADGYINITAVSGRQLRSAMQAAGVGEFFGEVMDMAKIDPARVTERFDEIIGPKLLKRSAAEWEQIFAEADVPAAALRTFDDHLDDAQIAHNKTYHPVADPGLGTDFLQVRFPAIVDGDRIIAAETPAPELEQFEPED